MKLAKIEIILTGGIGNQLFQYAYGRYLSLKENLPLQINLYKYGIHTLGETRRNFGLQNLNISGEIINSPRIVGKNRFLDRVLKRGILRRYKFEGNNSDFAEINWGYWLDVKYANAIRKELLAEFSLKTSIPEELKDLFDKFEKNKVLGIHVRRGDYVSNKFASTTHGVLDPNYYLEAIEIAKQRVGFHEICFFTDDPEWVKTNFKTVTVIEHKMDPIFDILLMARASGLIISNSTFSWWSAWMNEKSECTIAPKKWFISQTNPSIYDPKWILI